MAAGWAAADGCSRLVAPDTQGWPGMSWVGSGGAGRPVPTPERASEGFPGQFALLDGPAAGVDLEGAIDRCGGRGGHDVVDVSEIY